MAFYLDRYSSCPAKLSYFFFLFYFLNTFVNPLLGELELSFKVLF